MEYVPSTVARSLIANRTWTIGMVLPEISDPFMGRVVEGVEHVAIEAGFNVFLSTSQNDREREIAVVDVLQQRRVDGIVVIASHLFDRYIEYYDRTNLPIVIINEKVPGDNLHYVTVDDVCGVRVAIEHLLQLGHRRIGYIGIGNRARSNLARMNAYEQALSGAGIAFDPALISDTAVEEHAAQGEASLEALLAAGATAVFCYNDSAALGVLSACYQRTIAVPQCFSVIGFDDIDVAAYAVPPLTTIRQPRFALGQTAMQMMLDLLAGLETANQVLPGELVIRRTTARPAISH
jgi:LacI family transcriptional regulator/LacI family repressor for deo operon, udp, cdd, tsx, nupC, and nupG